MKRLMITVAALALLGAPAAFAQQGGGPPQDHRGGQGEGRPQNQGQEGGQRPGRGPGGQPPGAPPGQIQRRTGPVQQRAGQPPFQGQVNRERRQERHEERRGPPQQGVRPNLPQTVRPGLPQAVRPPFQQGPVQEQRHERREPGRFGVPGTRDRYRDYERNVPARRRFHLGTFAWPHGWSYRRWVFGQFLPPVFFAQSYWLYNYGAYGLPYPPPGTVWVRYGPDALLVDRETGEIIQVIYGIFY